MLERSKPGAESMGGMSRPGHDPLTEVEILDRLKRVEGQIRGIQKMVQEHRSCNDIITQLAAVKAAISQVSLTVIKCHLAERITQDLLDGNDFRESLDESMTIFRKFV